jgi:hypothetical protein
MFDFRADADRDFGAIVSAGEKAFRLRDGEDLSLIIVAARKDITRKQASTEMSIEYGETLLKGAPCTHFTFITVQSFILWCSPRLYLT